MLKGFPTRSDLQSLRSEGRVVLSSAAGRGVIVATVALIIWISLGDLQADLVRTVAPGPFECLALMAPTVIRVLLSLTGGVIVGALAVSLAQTRAAIGWAMFRHGPHRRGRNATPSLFLTVLAIWLSVGMFCVGAPLLLHSRSASASPELIGQQLGSLLGLACKLVVVAGVVSAILVWSVDRIAFLFRHRDKAR